MWSNTKTKLGREPPVFKHGKDPKAITLDPLHKWGWINNDQHLTQVGMDQQ